MSEINLDSLDTRLRETVLSIAKRISKAGGKAWIVGGSVRDLLIGSSNVKDVDLEVFGLEADRLKSVLSPTFEFDECGASFGVLKVKHVDIDIALPRRESKRGLGHKGFLIDSDPFLSVEEAASRRDFTINALYFDPITGEFADPYNGVSDLKNRIMRHVSSKFSEDPLRVLRGMQFAARFSLSADQETIELCRTMGSEGLPPERLFEEWKKLLTKGISISRGLSFLRDTGWVNDYPELSNLIGCKQDEKWHPEGDVWNHTCLALDAFAEHRINDEDEDLIVGLAVLCHDFGKPATSFFDPIKKHIRSLGHDEAGVKPTLSFLHRITNEERILKEVPPLVKCHMQPFAMWKSKVGDAAVRRLAMRVVRIDRLLRVAQADDLGRSPELIGGSSGGEDLRWLAETAERLRIADSSPKPILQGRDLIALGMKPGPSFGEYLNKCFEAQLDGKFSTYDDGLIYLTSLINQ